jgi:hypothetical protein
VVNEKLVEHRLVDPVETNNDHCKNHQFEVITASKIHLPLSICGSFTHGRLITYNIKKRSTKGNDRESNIDRVW